MGMKFRKSFKIAPGVKLNLSKRGIGVSAGVKGARVSLNSKGRVTKSVGIPGTGISYVSSSTIGATKKKTTAKKSSAKASTGTSTAFTAVNPSTDSTPAPPTPDNSSPNSGGKMNPKSILRWVVYIAIIFIATRINEKLCYPSMFLVGLFHLFQARKALSDEQTKKKSTIRTCCFLVFTIFGCILTLPTPKIESIQLSADKDTMDINEEQLISFTYRPTDANASNIAIELSAPSLAKAEQTEDGKIVLHTQEKEGTFTLVAKSGSVESNELTFQVIDKEKAEQERIAAQKKAEEERIAAEKKAEEERIAAEKAEQERIAAEKAEQERIAAEKAEQERVAAQRQSQAQSQNSATVYVTPTGKRYHYSSSCNGGSYSPTTLDKALARGLTPCKKCVG